MKKELIGKKAVIVYNNQVLEGIIINETKNTIWLEKEKRCIKIIKQNAIIKLNGQIILGKQITKRPEERIKLR